MASLPGFFRGDAYDLVVDVSEYGVDVQGEKFTFTLKTSKADADADAVLQEVLTAPADANSAAGLVTIAVETAKTDLVAPGLYEFDVQWTRTGSRPLTVMASGTNPDGTEYDLFEVFEDTTRTEQAS